MKHPFATSAGRGTRGLDAIAWIGTLIGLGIIGWLGYTILMPSTPRPGPKVDPVGPVPSGVPPGISPEAELIEYAGHDIYIWEVLGPEPDLAFVEWRWVIVDPAGISVESGVVSTAGLTGAAEAQKAAKDWIDVKFVPDDSSGSGAGGAGA